VRVLIACEYSGRVRDAFIKKGHDAISCDLLPTESPGPHYQGNVSDVLYDGWDMMIAFPPCTYLTVSGASWFYHPEDKNLSTEKRRPHPLYPNRRCDQYNAVDFFMKLYLSPIKKIAIENPIGIMNTILHRPTQIIRPFQFGENSTKATCLWLKKTPPLMSTNIIKTEIHTTRIGKKYDKWWFESSLISDLKERQKFRSLTFQGIADAMAEQWG
jgi:hypothetical protein